MQSLKNQSQHAFTQFELTNHLLQNLNKFKLTPTAKLVLLELSSFYNPKKADMFPKQKTIASKLGVSEASVIRAISELHKEGLIISERKYTNRYKFTARIVSEQPESEKIFTQNKMQVENNQNKIKQTCNLQPHEHEQTKETKKEQTTVVSDYKILKDYAVQKGAKNVKAYINTLVKNGAAQDIIKENRKKDCRSEFYKAQTKEVLQNYEEISQNCDAPTESWRLLGEKLKRLKP